MNFKDSGLGIKVYGFVFRDQAWGAGLYSAFILGYGFRDQVL